MVLHSGLFFMAYKDLRRINNLVFRVFSLMRACVTHLVLHREPFFFLAIGLRYLYRLKKRGYDASLTMHFKPVEIC